MSHNLLKGKRGIIFGALNDMSIAWKVAERAVEEGATITLSNTPIAVRMGQVDALAEKLNAQVIPADATSVEDLETVFAKSVEILGGYIYGREKGVRVNTISQSPTMTTAGSGVKGMEHLMDFSNKMSPLGNANADECADYCVMMFSDFTRKVTMQNLYHDGGFSSMGMSLRAMNQYSKGLEEYTDENGHIIYG